MIHGVCMLFGRLIIETLDRRQFRMLRGLRIAQKEVMAEQLSMQMLLSMICDCFVWLAADGDTVIRCDRRFNMLTRKSMQNLKLSSCLVQSESERWRLSQALATSSWRKPIHRCCPFP